MRMTQAGIDLIKSFEGCRLTAYKDAIGILTVGYGHTGPDVHADMTINEAAAESFLVHDLERMEKAVSGMVTNARLSDAQFSALVCFAYNVGPNNLKQSTLLRCVNKGNMPDAAKEFLKWDHAQGRVLAGLTRRRKAESDLFQS